MAFFKNIKLLGPLLSIAIVGVAIGTSLSGYELPHYEVVAQAAEVVDDRPMPAEAQNDAVIGAGNWELDDGVYRGRGVGYSGDILVDVTIADKTITQIDIVSTNDDAAYLNLAKGVISSILSTQSLDVDTVSGATYSSNGIIKAVRNALTGEEDTSTVEKHNEGQGSTSVSAVEDASAYKDGVYYGTGTGFGGKMTVKVVIENGKIVSIDVVSHKDDAAFFNRAVVLLSKMIEKQSTNVDTVSGATYSSVGLINATRDALRQAAVDAASEELNAVDGEMVPDEQKAAPQEIVNVEEPAAYKDGVYYGTGTGFGGEMKLKVVISGGKITSVEVVSSKDDEEYFSKARVLLERIVNEQSTNIDTVSGATYSSAGIIQAARDALRQAAVNPSDQEDLQENKDTNKDNTQMDTGTIPYIDGTYSGTGEGWGGDILVSITIKDRTLTEIVVNAHEDETEEFYNRAVDVIDKIIAAQSTDVDVISGATFSSEGIIEAVQNALNAAKEATDAANYAADKSEDASEKEDTDRKEDNQDPKEDNQDRKEENQDSKEENQDDKQEDSSGEETKTGEDADTEVQNGYKDGTYTGSAICAESRNRPRFHYNMGVTVTIRNNEITDITNVTEDGIDHSTGTDNSDYISDAVNGYDNYTGILAQILTMRDAETISSGSINAVSGATYSSEAVFNAVKDALSKAKN